MCSSFHGVAPVYLSDLCVPATAISSRQRLALYWLQAPGLQLDNEVSQSTDQPPFTTSTTVTGLVGERLQAGTEDAPVLDRPAPLRRFHDSGAGYKYPDLLTYLLITRPLDLHYTLHS